MAMKNSLQYVLIFFISFILLYCLTAFTTHKDYVPDEVTAIKIAEAVWLPIYGKEILEKQKPFKAVLVQDSIWCVSGFGKHSSNDNIVEYDKQGNITHLEVYMGGGIYAYINKKDGRIIDVYGTK